MAYQRLEGASLLAFCDIDEDKAKNSAKEFGCELWFGLTVDIGHPRDSDGINPFVKKEKAR